MAQWRVWNKHPMGYTHKEEFKDETIEIPANEYILMDYEDAVQFRGQYFPMKKTAQGTDDPKGFKVLFLEPHNESLAASIHEESGGEFVCHFDGRKFPTQQLLDRYIKQNYADEIFVDEALEEEIKKSKAKRV